LGTKGQLRIQTYIHCHSILNP